MADFTAGAVLTAAQLDTAFNTFTINAQTGTTYTLGAADAGEMVTVNNNSGGTVTVPTNATTAFETGTHIAILNAGTAGTFTVAGAGGVTLTSDVTALAPRAAITVVKTATNTWYGVSGGLPKASVSGTTGSPTVDTSSRPGKTIYTWTGDGSITVSTSGVAEILLQAAGAGGGQGSGTINCGGGGGGGQFESTTFYLPAGTHTITIGAGGAARSPGGDALIGTLVQAFGGGTGGGDSAGAANGYEGGYKGGSGGGGHCSTVARFYTGGSGVTNQGSSGGNGDTGGTAAGRGGGGGGGASAAGSNGTASVGGNGGAGKASSITGSSVTRGGGGGGARNSGSPGSGGSGGGGAGGTTTGTNGTANTGGGGGGSYSTNAAGSGGSGTVIVVIG